MRSRLSRAARTAALTLPLLGCLHGNNAPSGGVELRVTTDPSGFLVSWPAGGAVEVQVGRCVATCEETEALDPTSEFSERVPAPEFAELSWHVTVPSGAQAPLRLGLTPSGGTVLVPYAEPATDTGAWAVFVVVESMRAQDVFTQTGVARLN
jgi:hypothetical protein